MSTDAKEVHVIANVAIVSRALLEFIDSNYKQMIYNRNKFHIHSATECYRMAMEALVELDKLHGAPHPDRACEFLRNLDPDKYGLAVHHS